VGPGCGVEGGRRAGLAKGKDNSGRHGVPFWGRLKLSIGRTHPEHESFIITGAAIWGLGVAGHENAGRVIAWVGMAMFAAMAVGAPLGMSLYTFAGFAAVAAATALIPLLTLLLVVPLPSVSAPRGKPAGFLKVIGAVWIPGVGSALSSLGYGAMLAFSSLLATERGWNPVWMTFTAFALALVAARLFFGQVPDRLGGAKVALACVIIEAVGLALLWVSPGPAIGVLGGALTGFGYSLVYPGLGAEAVRHAPPQSRGLAMGAFSSCAVPLQVSWPSTRTLSSRLPSRTPRRRRSRVWVVAD